MKVEAVPDSTYDMIGGLEKQVMEIKEVIELAVECVLNHVQLSWGSSSKFLLGN